MPVRVTFLPLGKAMEVDLDQMRYRAHGKPHSILDVALNHQVHLEHACGGFCACTTCHVIVKQGEELLSSMQEDEADRLDMAAGVTLHSRLGCQAVITRNEGELVVQIPSWSRNYASQCVALQLAVISSVLKWPSLP